MNNQRHKRCMAGGTAVKLTLLTLILALSSCVCISGPGNNFRCKLRLEEIRLP